MRVFLLAGLLALVATPLHAQRWLAPGDRVRIVQADKSQVTGPLGRVTDQGVTVLADTGAKELFVPRSAIVRIDASRGRGSNGTQGLLSGALAGFGLGAILGLTSSGHGDLGGNGLQWAGGLGASLALVGATVGLFAGALSTSENWDKGALLPKPEPGQGVRSGLGLSFRF